MAREARGGGASLHQVAFIVVEFQTHDVVLGHAVLQAAQTAGVFGNVAGQRGDGHGTGIGRIEEALGLHGGGELGGDHAGLHHGVQVFAVDFENLLQAVGQTDGAVHGVRHGSAGKVGTGAPHGDGKSGLVAEADDFTDLFRLGRTQNQRRYLGGQHGAVVGVALPVGFAGEHVFGTKQSTQVFD